MKKYTTYLSGLLLFLLACNTGGDKKTTMMETFNDTATVTSSSPSVHSLEKKSISVNELPSDISKNLSNDHFFSSLELIHAAKIQQENRVYYDLTFKNEEKQTIMAAFDESGNVVPL